MLSVYITLQPMYHVTYTCLEILLTETKYRVQQVSVEKRSNLPKYTTLQTQLSVVYLKKLMKSRIKINDWWKCPSL